MRDPEKAGSVCFADHRWISGWIACKDDPQSGMVDVLCDGQPLAKLACTLPVDENNCEAVAHRGRGFLFQLPRRYWDGAEHVVQVRHADCSQDLEHSPVRFRYLDESRHMPFQATSLVDARVLCLAPHSDDESFGCGGALALHARNGDAVKVVVLSDGARASRNGSTERDAYVRMREQEAVRACEILGVSDLDFWRLHDRELGEQPDLAKRIKTLLDGYAPTLVYSLSPMEFHPDHRAAALALWQAIQRSNWKGKVGFYEINRPLLVNTLVDIGEVLDVKRQACNVYQSQLANFPYTECALGLNRHRALTLPQPSSHAEGIYLATSESIRPAPPERFLAWQVLSQTPGSKSADLPVSVILRVRDHPLGLRTALENLSVQQRPPQEVLVMDASEAGAQRTAEAFQEFLPIRYQRLSANRASAHAFGEGLQQVSGVAVLFMNDYDLLPVDRLESLVSLFVQGDVGLAFQLEPEAISAVSMEVSPGTGDNYGSAGGSTRWKFSNSRTLSGTARSGLAGVLFGRAVIQRVECRERNANLDAQEMVEEVSVFLHGAPTPYGFPCAPLNVTDSGSDHPMSDAGCGALEGALRRRIAELESEVALARAVDSRGAGHEPRGIRAAIRCLMRSFSSKEQ